ncbi:UxaA family hydrolase [Cytobacillus firmus]|uniref:UxaA family hydrolase n=1 Tax=Cytobacillus firmus TaxID=1399 RepID=UPI00249404BF|nr:UxaA family hydrolase [Cytobacillus firmus]
MRAIKVDKNDNVAVVVQDIKKGERVSVEGMNILSLQDIPVGHKMALQEIQKDDIVMKYNVPIGKAISDITIGEHVHIHNVEDITEELCNENKEVFIKKGEEINL